AWRDRKPCAGYVAEGLVDGVAWSRRIKGKDGKVYRLPDRPEDSQIEKEEDDPTLGLALFVRDDGVIALTHFSAHPTVVQVNDLISADYPGALTEFLETHLHGCLSCSFLQGACGDVNPFYQTTSDFEDVRLYGQALGAEALKQANLLLLHHRHGWGSGKGMHLLTKNRSWKCAYLEPVLSCAAERMILPPRSDVPDGAQLEEEFQEELSQVKGAWWWMRADQPLTEQQKLQGQRVLIAWNRWQASLRLKDERNRTVEVQVLRLGPLGLVGVSGELFVGPGLRIRHFSPLPFTWVVGYANGYAGYLVDWGAFAAGGYEVSLGPWTVCGDGSGEMVADKALDLLKQTVQ
ncbi:MAG: hypothetical protein NZ959_03215, partial [Armatimonadetes bacterium]|nr:hypothetical protein [Armatimonadota bacterium]MDW8123134.1 hypothetical protein [Armatimonadota bacterium]